MLARGFWQPLLSAGMGDSSGERFTDYVLTIEGGTRDEVFDFLDRVVVPTLETVTELDVGLSSHVCNDAGDTFHSVLARNKILESRLEEVLDERATLEAAALVSPEVQYVRSLIRDALRDHAEALGDALRAGGWENDYDRGVRHAWRSAYLMAGGVCDGSEAGWAAIEGDGRG